MQVRTRPHIQNTYQYVYGAVCGAVYGATEANVTPQMYARGKESLYRSGLNAAAGAAGRIPFRGLDQPLCRGGLVLPAGGTCFYPHGPSCDKEERRKNKAAQAPARGRAQAEPHSTRTKPMLGK
jgi:hypothetical protein